MGEDLEKFVERYPTYIEALEQIEQLKQHIAELEKETEAYQKEINDFCNKRYFGCLKDADKKLTELEEKCKWQDKEIELDGEKLKQAAEEFNKQHELLDQYELDCTDEIIRLKNQSIAKLKDEAETYKQRWCDVEANRLNWYKKHHDLMEENAKLQEQLKDAIVPKFKVGQKVWFIVDKRNFFQDGEYQPIQQVEAGSIKNFRIFAKGSKMQVHYRIKDSNCGWAETHSYREKELFTDEAEAHKHLK